jgi:hypothetical protein
MARDSRFIQIAFSIQKMLSDDGKLDEAELNELLGMANVDGEWDDEERRILGLILGSLGEKDVTPEAWKKIREVRELWRL